MADEKKETSKKDVANSDAAIQPDEETTGTTDPQEHMEGPISSLVQGVNHTMEKNGGKSEDSEKAKKAEE